MKNHQLMCTSFRVHLKHMSQAGAVEKKNAIDRTVLSYRRFIISLREKLPRVQEALMFGLIKYCAVTAKLKHCNITFNEYNSK